jgi:ribonuclease VapC
VIIDSSALLALVLREPEAPIFASAVADAIRVRIGSANWLEAAMVVDRRGDPVAAGLFDDFIRQFSIEIAALTLEHVIRGRQAWRDFGKGSGHPANLNFGDCLAYGFARVEGEPLLFKGDDFAKTDIQPVLKP